MIMLSKVRVEEIHYRIVAMRFINRAFEIIRNQTVRNRAEVLERPVV